MTPRPVGELLTDAEHAALDLTGQLANAMGAIIGGAHLEDISG